jgi:tetratricopeptide (TPR) repeat protein
LKAIPRAALLVALLFALPFTLAAFPHATMGQGADSLTAMIERRLSAGDRAGARSVAESLLIMIPPTALQYADALYWRAFTSANAAHAERDYLRVAVEYPLTRRAPDALLNLALLEYARKNRTGARRHFDQLLREHPSALAVAKASYWSARLSFEDGDVTHGCASLATARLAAATEDVELLNQIDYQQSRCTAARADSATRADTSRAAPRDSADRAPPRKPEFSIQVASYSKRRDAEALAGQLKRQGLPSRVVGSNAPFRVRLGLYATKEDAIKNLVLIKRGNPRAIIVEAEPQ